MNHLCVHLFTVYLLIIHSLAHIPSYLLTLFYMMKICFFLFSASSSAQGQGQKRQAPDVLSKYSLKHSIEEKVAAALQSEKKDFLI